MKESLRAAYEAKRKRSRNRLQRALNGNGPGWMKTLAFLAAVPLVWRTEQGAEEVVDALTSYAQRTIAEVEEVSVDCAGDRKNRRVCFEGAAKKAVTVVEAVVASGFAGVRNLLSWESAR